MTSQRNGTIPCTVGILTYNSETFLERCLRGLTDFKEVLIADGGSTDTTLDIAKRYGCTIISQSNPGHPINDFALERNRMVEASACDWFLSLDSDELITPELIADIRRVTETDGDGVYIYRVPYRIISEDLQTLYASFKTYYQHRFFNRKSGARYTRKVHERITFEAALPQGTLTGAWHVPLDIQLDFKIYKQKVDHRIRIMVAERPPRTALEYIKRMTIEPARNIAKQLIKFAWLRITNPPHKLTPIRYEAYKLYSQLMFMKEATRQYARVVRQNLKTGLYAAAYAVRSLARLWDKRPEVTVLMYHAINDDGGKLSVSPKAFEQQLQYLKAKTQVVPLEEIVAYARGERTLSGHVTAITFDDGYTDLEETVLPMLREHNMTATVFIPSNMDAYTNPAKTPRLSAAAVQSLEQTGTFTFEAHGKTHHALTLCEDEELAAELSDAKRELQALLGRDISMLAYPYGARDRRVESATKQAGYTAAWAITEGTIEPGDNLFSLKRVQVDSTTSPRLFKWRLTRAVSLHRWTIDRLRAML
ncbi:MAG: hypothetical protein RL150_603 [Candidatus Parcubacteria bacterium]|jgi:peptidoglycan/xylan/chitin deacetylase (PgdA/CDA1 family)